MVGLKVRDNFDLVELETMGFYAISYEDKEGGCYWKKYNHIKDPCGYGCEIETVISPRNREVHIYDNTWRRELTNHPFAWVDIEELSKRNLLERSE